MSWRRTRARVLGFAAGGRRHDDDLRQEMRSHIEIETDENIERGMTPEEARRQAMIKFGNQSVAQEDAQNMWSLPSLESVMSDARFGWRVLWKAPGFALVAVLTLALGIGATTAIFSVAYSVLLRPLPYPKPRELMLVYQDNKAEEQGNWRVTALDYLDLRERSRTFSGMAAYTGAGMVFSGGGDTELVLGQRVSANMFSVLQVAPMLGRDFAMEEEEKGRDRVLILSYGLWQRRFGGDPTVIGRVVTVSSEPYTVIGVMPRGFSFPAKQYQAWAPQAFRGKVDPLWVNRSAHYLRVIGRLKPGVTAADASREMQQIAADLERQYPETDANTGARIESLTESVVGDVRTSLFLLLGAAMCLLLIACTNIANLLLARGTAREREIAIRQALGAGNKRIFRQLLTENLLLALGGGTIGAALAYALVWAVLKLGPQDLPRLDEIRVDAPALLFAFVVAVATGVFFGLTPLFSLRRHATAETLKGTATATTGGRGLQRLRSVLVTAEIATCGVLLIVAGLTVRSLMRLGAVDPGFNPDGAVSFSFVMMEAPFPTAARMRAYTHRLLDELRGAPGIENAAFIEGMPLSGNSWSNPVTTDGSDKSPILGIREVSPGYFEAMQMPVRKGRSFGTTETETSEKVAVISETTARKVFGSDDPIGRHVKLGDPQSTDQWRRIVGIVADVRERGLDVNPEPVLYLPYDQLGDDVTRMTGRGLYMVLRTQGDPTAAISFARARMAEIDATVPMHDVQLLRESVSASVAQPRFRTFLFAGFGLLALVLAGVGLYGVLSYAVAQRTHEFGIRIALGARRSNLLGLVFGQGSRLVLIGLGIAVVGAMAVRRAVQTLLFGISSSDPITFTGVVLIIAAIAALAIFIPARRAMRANPLSAIRYE